MSIQSFSNSCLCDGKERNGKSEISIKKRKKRLNNKSLKPLTGLQKGNLKPNRLLRMTKTKTKKINNELSGSNQWRLT